MRTVITTDPATAAGFIAQGELAAFPTETVFGLGADARDPSAIAKIFAAKNRPADNPIIVHVATASDVPRVVSRVPPIAVKLIDHFFPGPITLLLPRNASIPKDVTAGSRLVGVRMPDHPMALAVIQASGCPVAAPSANRSGRPSPTTWQAVRDDLDGKIACILAGRPTNIGLESTVVDVSGETPTILRPGAVSLDEITKVVGHGRYASAKDALLSSPGVRHRHYAPDATVRLVSNVRDIDGDVTSDAYIGLESLPPELPMAKVLVCKGEVQYAQKLFNFFRECDHEGVRRIWCQTVIGDQLGVALMDRLERAARG